jgi:hypothetical protein
MLHFLRRPEPWVFAILLGSYAFFWHSRDWNISSRLMLTYAIVDRGVVSIDGLEDHTGDLALFHHHYYSDKLPGYSFLAVFPYALGRFVFGLPPHPLGVRGEGFAYWPADYWVTLGVSGVLTALTGAVLVGLARDLGCGPRRSALVGLAYGLATPAYAYATLSYGHQATAFALLTSFGLLWRTGGRRPGLQVLLAGFLAAYASVIELQVGPVSAILGFYLLAQIVSGQRPWSSLGDFAVGAAIPTLLLLGYNQLAFGSPFILGYFHHATAVFAKVHNTQNPLGLVLPDLSKIVPLLVSEHRGLFFYAPILVLALPGWVVLAARRVWGMAIVSLATALAVFLVNLSYPEWMGGWSTGPRLLVPLLPFAMLPVAGVLAVGGRWVTALALVLALWGGVLNFLYQGIGGRVHPMLRYPFQVVVWPFWRGNPLASSAPFWLSQERFERTAVGVLWPEALANLPERWKWVQFVPLVVVQALAIGALVFATRPTRAAQRGP